jgi:hypothetical protein
VAGVRYDDTDPMSSSWPGIVSLSVSSSGRGCSEERGWFTFDELARDPWGEVVKARLRFEQRCWEYYDSGDALRGLLEFRAGDTTAPAPWTGAGPGATGTTVLITGIAPDEPPPDDEPTDDEPPSGPPHRVTTPQLAPPDDRGTVDDAVAPRLQLVRGRQSRLRLDCRRCRGWARLRVGGRVAAYRRFDLPRGRSRINLRIRPRAVRLLRRSTTPVESTLTIRIRNRPVRRELVRLALKRSSQP